jgi:hypothetical protein
VESENPYAVLGKGVSLSRYIVFSPPKTNAEEIKMNLEPIRSEAVQQLTAPAELRASDRLGKS